jgi:hypothetical protein
MVMAVTVAMVTAVTVGMMARTVTTKLVTRSQNDSQR